MRVLRKMALCRFSGTTRPEAVNGRIYSAVKNAAATAPGPAWVPTTLPMTA